MAHTTQVNSMITDSIAQVNTKVLGDAPAMGMGNLFVVTSQALSNAAHNATGNQHNSTVTLQATTVQGVSTLFSANDATAGGAAARIRIKRKQGPS